MNRNLVGSIYGWPAIKISFRYVNKHGHHMQFLFLVGQFLKQNSTLKPLGQINQHLVGIIYVIVSYILVSYNFSITIAYLISTSYCFIVVSFLHWRRNCLPFRSTWMYPWSLYVAQSLVFVVVLCRPLFSFLSRIFFNLNFFFLTIVLSVFFDFWLLKVSYSCRMIWIWL